MAYVISYSRPWCKSLIGTLNNQTSYQFVGIDNEKKLTTDYLNEINPKIIFFPHWSHIIPKEIYESYNCIIFHMTDLPYGRGGSPLQNLILAGKENTMISAIKCIKEIDAGPIYLKKPLNLNGSAEEIFLRANKIIQKMIMEIIDKNLSCYNQSGTVTTFARRKPEEGDLINAKSFKEFYDYIRMLDAEGYPNAFIRLGKYKIEFFRASIKVGSIHASVKIIEEKK
jgi:methionyl-tRNA formyltransferase